MKKTLLILAIVFAFGQVSAQKNSFWKSSSIEKTSKLARVRPNISPEGELYFTINLNALNQTLSTVHDRTSTNNNGVEVIIPSPLPGSLTSQEFRNTDVSIARRQRVGKRGQICQCTGPPENGRNQIQARRVTKKEQALRAQENIHPVAFRVRVRIVDHATHRRERFRALFADAYTPPPTLDDRLHRESVAVDVAVPVRMQMLVCRGVPPFPGMDTHEPCIVRHSKTAQLLAPSSHVTQPQRKNGRPCAPFCIDGRRLRGVVNGHRIRQHRIGKPRQGLQAREGMTPERRTDDGQMSPPLLGHRVVCDAGRREEQYRPKRRTQA